MSEQPTPPIAPADRGTREAVLIAIEEAGGTAKVQEAFGFKTHQAVRRWLKHGVPPEHVRQLCKLTDHRVKPIDLRPDVFDLSDEELPAHRATTLPEDRDIPREELPA